MTAAPVPGYLGRILDDGDPVGTCFQVAPGVLVTAWHVLNDIGAAAPDSPVQVDPLAGGDPFEATVARLDATHDLAVLVSGTSLPATAGTLTATDQMTMRAPVTVTGHAEPDDPGHTFRFLNAPGEWAGWTTRDDTVPLGRMTADALVPGMSGAPVICDGDGAVAGVVSGRYNTADGWLADTVWVARTEDLAVLLDGVAGVTMRQVPLAGPVDLLLTVDTERVRLSAGPGIDISAAHGGVRPGLAEAVNEARRARARIGQVLASAAASRRTGRGPVAGPGGPAAGRVVPARPGRGRADQAAGRGGTGVSAGPAGRGGRRRSWPGCRGRRCPAPMAAARWRCTRWSACTARPAPRRRAWSARAAADRGRDRRPAGQRRRRGAGLRAGAAQRAGRGPRRPPGRRRRAGGAVRDPGGDPRGTGPRPGARAARLPGTAPPGSLELEDQDGNGAAGHRRGVPGPGDPAGRDAAGDHACRPATPTRPPAEGGVLVRRRAVPARRAR